VTPEEAILKYAKDNAYHIGYHGMCAPSAGDRCDVTAALYHAAKIAKEHQHEHSEG
jgi:hypothetical protein